MSTTIPKLSFSGGTLILEGMTREAVARCFGQGGWTWDARISAWRRDAIDYADVADCLRAGGGQFEDLVPQWQPIRWPQVEIHKLRKEQAQAVRAWQQTGRACIVMPTGTGKTEVALSIMAQTATSTLVVAPVRDLMYQWHRRILAGLGYDPGIIGDNVFRVRPVSVTTYDSACIHMQRLGNQFGLIVFDECHHLPGPIRRDAARMSAAPLRMGLTATPERSDGRHVDLDALVGPIAYEMPISEAKGQTLADYEVVRIPVHLSPSEQARYDRLSQQVRSYMAERRKDVPDFDWEDLCAETGKTPEARQAMKAYLAKKSIEDRAQEKLRVLERPFPAARHRAVHRVRRLERDGPRRPRAVFLIPCLLSHCGKKERLEVLQGLEQGTYRALVANQVLDEGVDLPAVKVAIVIGGTASSRQAKQRLGRVLRKSGNVRAMLYEVVSAGTNEARRSRHRRRSDAYQDIRHRKL